ncbi:Cysteine protease atg4 [Polyrhizophydium stewartii]|uniref:Cysteine protease n=1 Tax=Polyrhizophydium stewartii TaxID=2732419 RepID=A0ABR4MVQ2_9FUNG
MGDSSGSSGPAPAQQRPRDDPEDDFAAARDSPAGQPPIRAADDTLWQRFSEGLSFLMRTARDKLRRLDGAEELLRFARYPSPRGSGGQVLFLARTYPSLAHPDFLDDFQSRLWITYRRGFPPIKPSSFTSDSGWGCMLRSGQMLLANALLFHLLGRDWRIADKSEGSWLAYTQIVSRFLDVNASPFSIHRIAILGKQFDKEIGEWFGPSTISQVLRVLVNDDPWSSMRVHVANDGVVYKNEIRTLLAKTREDGKPTSVLLLIPLRLGVDTMNPVYYPAIKHCFGISHCVGIAGGRPNSSLFFLGNDQDNLIYLDPHYLRPCVEPRDLSSYKMEDLLSYHCETVRLLPIASMDPSLVIGFYCRDAGEFDSLCTAISGLAEGQTPLFSVEEDTPRFDADVDIVSEEDF